MQKPMYNMRSFCPFRRCVKLHLLTLIGECDAAGEKHRFCFFIPGTVFVVTHQRKAPAGKLNPDLMTTSGVQPDTDKTLFSGG